MKEKSIKYNFDRDSIQLFKCEDFKEIEEVIENIFKENEKILPKDKNAKILIKPNFNNDLNALTGNSTDLRIIVPVLKELKKRNYKDITLADGPNCGVNHIGIDVFSRLSLDKVAKMFDIKLLNLNHDEGIIIELTTGEAEVSKTCLDANFIINLPKLKTHVEVGMSCACKNYMGCLKGTQKRKMHNNLDENIIRLNEIIKTDLIIVDGLIGMEGQGPGDGTPKKLGVIISGHNPFLIDLFCSKLIDLKANVPYLKIALQKKYISYKDDNSINLKQHQITKFKSARKTLADRILLNNFFIGIRFSRIFQKSFNKGFLPWLLFKMGVKQDKYILEDMNITKLYEKKGLTKNEKKNLKKCLKIYCPLGLEKIENKKCLKCMYCYQVAPSLITFDGELNAFQMQRDRFGGSIKIW